MLTQDQKSALEYVYAAICGDIPSDYDPLEKAEIIIDGGKLTIYGFPEIDKQIGEYVKKDYGETLAMIARELNL